MATNRKTTPAQADPEPETPVDPQATADPDAPQGQGDDGSGEPETAPARRLAYSVYVTDDEGRTVIYEPGDVPAPEHAAQIGDHAYEKPDAPAPLHPHSREFDAQVRQQLGPASPKLALMDGK